MWVSYTFLAVWIAWTATLSTGQFADVNNNSTDDDAANCTHNRAGESCDVCLSGYFMEQHTGHCHICACPLPRESNNFAEKCTAHPHTGETFSCLCEDGYAGNFCERCAPGYYGKPTELGGSCEEVDCSGNVDTSDPTSYDNVTGECLTCSYNSVGQFCERCQPGMYGDAVTAKNCKACRCDWIGAMSCDDVTGACRCKTNVVGTRCDQCREFYAGIGREDGCIKCACKCAGGCDVMTGECACYALCFSMLPQHCALLWGIGVPTLFFVLFIIVKFRKVLRLPRKNNDRPTDIHLDDVKQHEVSPLLGDDDVIGDNQRSFGVQVNPDDITDSAPMLDETRREDTSWLYGFNWHRIVGWRSANEPRKRMVKTDGIDAPEEDKC